MGESIRSLLMSLSPEGREIVRRVALAVKNLERFFGSEPADPSPRKARRPSRIGCGTERKPPARLGRVDDWDPWNGA